MINYDALIKRVKNAIDIAKNNESPAAVYIVTNDDDISELSGLVVIIHPDYIKSKMDTLAQC